MLSWDHAHTHTHTCTELTVQDISVVIQKTREKKWAEADCDVSCEFRVDCLTHISWLLEGGCLAWSCR